MPGSSRTWMISYAYRPIYRKVDGGFQFGNITDAIELIDKHPAQYIAKIKKDHELWREGKLKMPGDRGPDDIQRVYSATPLAPSEVTAAVIEAFE